jgi:hypothetical protein
MRHPKVKGLVMPTWEPRWLADDFWLAAHDSVKGRSLVGDWPLGVGLAAGLLAELILCGYVDLRQGELFREMDELPNDPALRPLLVTMAEEELFRQPPESGRVRTSVPVGSVWPAPPADGGRRWPQPAQQETRHRQHGHELAKWISYLAYQHRAEDLVVGRLAVDGLIKPEKRHRWTGRTTVRNVPRGSNAAGTPANLIIGAVQRGLALSQTELILARLFFATGLDLHALATLTPAEQDQLSQQLELLHPTFRELLHAADAAVGDNAMR